MEPRWNPLNNLNNFRNNFEMGAYFATAHNIRFSFIEISLKTIAVHISA